MVDYLTVSCDLYDEITNAILRKNSVKLITGDICYQGFLTDVYTKNKEEFCVVNDSHIRLDKIEDLLFDNEQSSYFSYRDQKAK